MYQSFVHIVLFVLLFHFFLIIIIFIIEDIVQAVRNKHEISLRLCHEVPYSNDFLAASYAVTKKLHL